MDLLRQHHESRERGDDDGARTPGRGRGVSRGGQRHQQDQHRRERLAPEEEPSFRAGDRDGEDGRPDRGRERRGAQAPSHPDEEHGGGEHHEGPLELPPDGIVARGAEGEGELQVGEIIGAPVGPVERGDRHHPVPDAMGAAEDRDDLRVVPDGERLPHPGANDRESREWRERSEEPRPARGSPIHRRPVLSRVSDCGGGPYLYPRAPAHIKALSLRSATPPSPSWSVASRFCSPVVRASSGPRSRRGWWGKTGSWSSTTATATRSPIRRSSPTPTSATSRATCSTPWRSGPRWTAARWWCTSRRSRAWIPCSRCRSTP